MATKNLPQIGGDFVVLVESMRKSQAAYFKTRGSRELHDSKRLERLVDAMIGGWRREVEKLASWSGGLKTDELPGVYEVREE